MKTDKLKLIFKKIARKLGFFMTSDEKQQKKKFLINWINLRIFKFQIVLFSKK